MFLTVTVDLLERSDNSTVSGGCGRDYPSGYVVTKVGHRQTPYKLTPLQSLVGHFAFIIKGSSKSFAVTPDSYIQWFNVLECAPFESMQVVNHVSRHP